MQLVVPSGAPDPYQPVAGLRLNARRCEDLPKYGDIGQLYERLVHGNGSILLGILVPEAAREIEDWLNNPVNRRWQPTR